MKQVCLAIQWTREAQPSLYNLQVLESRDVGLAKVNGFGEIFGIAMIYDFQLRNLILGF